MRVFEFRNTRLDLATISNHTPRPLAAMVAADKRERLMMRTAPFIAKYETNGSFDLCGNVRAFSREGRMS